MNRRHRGKVQRIPSVAGEGPDSSLAEDDTGLSLEKNVFRREQKRLPKTMT